jgi:diacylglycerol O-acyltransferase / wax synthase
MLEIFKPITATYAFLFFLFWSTDNNLIKSNVNLKSKKNNAICKTFSVPELKRVSKHYGCTLNDVVLSILSSSLKQYFETHGDEKTQSINLLVPFSLRELPKTIAEHKMNNDFNVICFTLAMKKSFEEAIKVVSAKTRKLKGSLYPFAVKALTEIIAWFPGIVGQLVMMWVVSKATIVLSNVPGPKRCMKFGDVKCKGLVGLIPGLGDLAFGISAMSQGDQLIMAIQSDLDYVEDPRELRDLFEVTYDKLIATVSEA